MKNKLLIVGLIFVSIFLAGAAWRMCDPDRFGPDPLPMGPNILMP